VEKGSLWSHGELVVAAIFVNYFFMYFISNNKNKVVYEKLSIPLSTFTTSLVNCCVISVNK
jgi:hypothetical protein